MKTFHPLTILLSLVTFGAFAQDYKNAWDKLNAGDMDGAISILEPKIKAKSAGINEFITYQLTLSMSDQDDRITDFLNYAKKSEQPDAYIYALWFTPPVVGGYGYKDPNQ